MQLTLLDILVLLSLPQGFLFGFVLLFSRVFKGSPNRYLAYFVIIISIIGMDEWLSTWGYAEQYYAIDYFGDDVPWILLVPVPLVYFFLQSLHHPLSKHKYLPLLTLPFGIYLLLNLIINFEFDFQWYEVAGMEPFRYWVYQTESMLGPVYSIVLCGLIFPLILKSEVKEIDKRWLSRIMSFLLGLIGCWLLLEMLPMHLGQTYYYVFYSLWIGISCFIYWISYQGLFEFRLARDLKAAHTWNEDQQVSKEDINPKEETRPADFDADNNYLQVLNNMLLKEHIYRDPNLNRNQVAQKLGISPGYLSQIINRATGNNFASYINTQRVEEVKRNIQGPESERYSLLAIGMDAGFKSKSAFYTSFKKITRMTPSQFKKQQQ